MAMYTHVKSGASKSPKPPNPSQMGGTCKALFRAALRERRSKYPFDRISAYKVRECFENLRYELDVVVSIARYLQTPASERRSSMLLGCTSDDKARRLKAVPETIARELGYNLIPAIEALHLEGVKEADIARFILNIKPQVDQLIADCDAVREATTQSIRSEYAALAAGNSEMANACAGALHLAAHAVQFCKNHNVL